MVTTLPDARGSAAEGSRRGRRRPCTFKKQDVTRALQATLAAGIEVSRIEIDKGRARSSL